VKKLLIGVISFMVVVVGVVCAESVSIDDLDKMFLNYDKDGEAGWGDLAPKPGLAKVHGGKVQASGPGAVGHEGPAKAFDGNSGTKYCTKAPTMWLQYTFDKGKKCIVAYAITTANDAPERDPKDWALQGSNDGKEWAVVDKRSGERFSDRFQRRQFEVAKPGEYTIYKLDVTKNHGEDTSQISELELLTAEDLKKRNAPRKLKKIKRTGPLTNHPDVSGWSNLFADALSNADYPKGVWTVSNGEFTASKDQALWTKKAYENYVVDLEFKTAPGSNSGVLVHVTDTKRWIPNSVEVQITDDYAEKWAKANPTWRCGAIFGRLAAKKSVVKKPGEWNRFTVTCEGPFVDVVLNGEHVTAMDMRKWNSATKNPDGSSKPGWLNKPLSKHPTRGKIGLQGKHAGAPIWFRSIKIKEL